MTARQRRVGLLPRTLLAGMLLTAFLRGALTWLQTQYLLRLQTKLAVRMSAEFFWHVLRLPIDFFTQRYRGEIGSRINLNDMVAAVLSQPMGRRRLVAA